MHCLMSFYLYRKCKNGGTAIRLFHCFTFALVPWPWGSFLSCTFLLFSSMIFFSPSTVEMIEVTLASACFSSLPLLVFFVQSLLCIELCKSMSSGLGSTKWKKWFWIYLTQIVDKEHYFIWLNRSVESLLILLISIQKHDTISGIWIGILNISMNESE